MIDHGKVLAHVCVDDGVDDQLSGQLALFCAHVPEDVGIGVPDGFDGKRQLGVNAQDAAIRLERQRDAPYKLI